MEIFERIGEFIGVGPRTRTRQETVDREFTESLNRKMEERRVRVHMLGQHSNACLSEIEYLIGIAPEPPHPGHLLTFTECTCPRMLS